tara:strand:- start:4002 stop:5621 length:1620 start_codon:yes stop_codon:yes gene_type:complete
MLPSPCSPTRIASLGHRSVSSGRSTIGVWTRILGLLGIGLLASCAGFQQERHLAPLFTELSLAGGDRGIEALGGMVLTRRDAETKRIEYWAVRPFASHRKQPGGRSFSWYLPPFGQRFVRPAETVTQFLPIWRYAKQHPEGEVVSWQFLTLPGFYFAKDADGDRKSAWFLLYGDVDNFLSFDRAQWVLFPVYSKFERYGRTTHNALWPIFQWSQGAGGPSWRVWPLYGQLGWEGRYKRKFVLWPLYMRQTNDISRKEGDQQESHFLFPFYGQARREGAVNRTFLWPFFGTAKDEETGFWAWDGPWPLVVFQGGDPERAVRQRVWPFYSFYKGDGLTSTWYGWPFINVRSEDYGTHNRSAVTIFPFWQQWDASYPGDLRAHWRKLWPLVRTYEDERGDSEFLAFPALNPMRRFDFIDEHYAWIWELYTTQRQYDRIRERSWLGLWRRERDRDEDRRSLVGLWANRKYSERGKRVSETSLLFGLIRWRSTEDEGRSALWPAVPGPGWPIERVPNSIAPVGVERPVGPVAPTGAVISPQSEP